MHHAGRNNIDNIVVKKTHLVANSSSPSYFAASMAVILAAGIAANNTHTLLASASSFKNTHTISVSAGIINSLIAENIKLVLLIIPFTPLSERIAPINIIVIGVMHELIDIRVLSMKSGNLKPVIIINKPTIQAITQGWVISFLTTDFGSGDSVK